MVNTQDLQKSLSNQKAEIKSLTGDLQKLEQKTREFDSYIDTYRNEKYKENCRFVLTNICQDFLEIILYDLPRISILMIHHFNKKQNMTSLIGI